MREVRLKNICDYASKGLLVSTCYKYVCVSTLKLFSNVSDSLAAIAIGVLHQREAWSETRRSRSCEFGSNTDGSGRIVPTAAMWRCGSIIVMRKS